VLQTYKGKLRNMRMNFFWICQMVRLAVSRSPKERTFRPQFKGMFAS